MFSSLEPSSQLDDLLESDVLHLSSLVLHPIGVCASYGGYRSGLNCDKFGLNCDRLGLSCGRLGLNCVRFGLNCIRFGLNCDRLGLNCDRFGFNCVRFGLNCVRFGLSCVRFELNCVRFGLNCDRFGLPDFRVVECFHNPHNYCELIHRRGIVTNSSFNHSPRIESYQCPKKSSTTNYRGATRHRSLWCIV